MVNVYDEGKVNFEPQVKCQYFIINNVTIEI